MKKNKTLRMASGLLVLAMITTCVISGTFAKYTSTASGSDEATVAKWSIKVNDTEIAVTGDAKTVSFGLFDTINDTGNTAEEDDVKKTLIAPGTSGSFKLNLENLSEVNAKYTITLSETNDSNIPLQYSLDGNSWADSFDALNESLKEKDIGMETSAAEHIVYWRWVYEGTTSGAHENQTDSTDTALGVTAQTTAGTVTISASITAWQVD
jgi:hypothetical protein